MAIKKWIITGDTHGKVAQRLDDIVRNIDPEDAGIIILGDAGFNFWLNDTDIQTKQQAAEYGLPIFCVRGNHEERPENLGYEKVWNDDVQGEVYLDPISDLIHYFVDGGMYNINGHRTLVIGGAYSIDKHHRILRAGLTEETNDPKKSGWFKDEQLSDWEMQAINYHCLHQDYDFVFTHTCPIDLEPTDLFLDFIDQSQVDKTMEMFLAEVSQEIKWKIWCFGHYHANRMEQPNVFQFYTEYENLSKIWIMGTEKYSDYKDMYPKGPRYKEES